MFLLFRKMKDLQIPLYYLMENGSGLVLQNDGIYRLDYSRIKELGLEYPANPRIYANNQGQLSYYNNDPKPDDLKEISISLISGSDNIFNEGDYLLFYAKGTHRWIYNQNESEYEYLRHNYSDTAVSSGGIYWFKDGRTVPDVLTTAFEFTDRNLSILYSATLANSRNRGKILMGHDGTMLLGNTMTIYADATSTKYADKIASGDIKPATPIVNFVPGKKSIDAVTTATEAYFVERGLLYTTSGGKTVNTVSLHLKNWLNCIRNGGTPVCDIDSAFEEGITAHMGTISYREGRRVYWDRDKELIV